MSSQSRSRWWSRASARGGSSGSRLERAAGRGRRRHRLGGAGRAGRSGQVLLGEKQVHAGCTLDDAEERRHARHLLALFLEEPRKELLADEFALLARELDERD